LLGAQAASSMAMIRTFKKHRDDRFPLHFLKASLDLGDPDFL
jgi:hypothetical protein